MGEVVAVGEAVGSAKATKHEMINKTVSIENNSFFIKKPPGKYIRFYFNALFPKSQEAMCYTVRQATTINNKGILFGSYT